jgi:hypothetical protein
MRALPPFVLLALLGGVPAVLAAQAPRAPSGGPAARRPAEGDRGGFAYYRNCDAARAAGAAPIRRGEPGYRAALDRDDDGIACEPARGRR